MENGPAGSAGSSVLSQQIGLLRRAARRLKVLLRLRNLYLLRAEIRFAPTEAQRLFAVTIAVGALCGLAAVAFHLSIHALEHLLIDAAMGGSGKAWMVWTVATPTAGALAAGLLLHFVVPNARGSGIPQVKLAFATKGGSVRMRDAAGKFLIGALQIGTGSSLGREGPTVQICAGISRGVGRLARVSPTSLRRLIPMGAAAGIAAAFNAPIAAVTFTIEEVVGNLDNTLLSGVIVAAALAAIIERSVLGEHPVFDVPQNYGLHHASSLLVYAFLGVAATVAAILFTDALLGLRARFRRMSNVPPWARPAVGGLLTGALAVVALHWFHTKGVTGGGYETLGEALTGKLTVRVMLVLCALKLLATVFSYSSGGAGGIFAPSLFIGGTLGGAIGNLDRTLLGHVNEPIGAFALVGMGAVFSGIVRAPMTSVLIIVEMTGGYSLILPLMIANMTAYVLARQFRPTPIYEALLEQDGVRLKDRVIFEALDGLRVGPLVNHAGPFVSFTRETPAERIARSLEQSRPQDVYTVLDRDGALVGIITADDVALLSAEPDLVPLTNALDMMRPPVSVRADDDLRAALDAMVAIGARQVPVTDADRRFIGFIEEATIGSVYLRRQRGTAAPDRRDSVASA